MIRLPIVPAAFGVGGRSGRILIRSGLIAWAQFRRRHGLARFEVEPDATSERKCLIAAGQKRAARIVGVHFASWWRTRWKFPAFADGLRGRGLITLGIGNRDTDPVSLSTIEVEDVVTHDSVMRGILIVARSNGWIFGIWDGAFGRKFRANSHTRQGNKHKCAAKRERIADMRTHKVPVGRCNAASLHLPAILLRSGKTAQSSASYWGRVP